MTAAQGGLRSTFRARLLWSLGAIILAVAVGPLIWNTAPDRAVSDLFFRIRGPLPTPHDIVIVGIDDQSFANLQLRWPWPRHLYSELIGSISSARVIAFDILFDTNDPNGHDLGFGRSIADHPNVILSTARIVQDNDRYATETWLNPIRQLADATPQVGNIEVPVDSDGVVRRAYNEIGGRATLGFLAARQYGGPQARISEEPIDIDFLGPAGTIETISFSDVLIPLDGSTNDPFRDKLVFVGITSEIGNDPNHIERFRTPFSRSGTTTPGVEIHANIASNLLTQSALTQLSVLTAGPLGGLLALVCGLFLFSSGVGRSTIFFTLITASIWILGYLMFSGAALYIQVASLTLPIGFVFVTGLTLHYYQTAQSEKRNRILLAKNETRIRELLVAQGYGSDLPQNQVIKVFLSYSHKSTDSSYMVEILEFLKGLKNEGIIFWNDEKIVKGDVWERELMQQLHESDMAVALVSQSYLDSDYCKKEVEIFLERNAVILPVILSPCEWKRHAWLSERQFIPAGGQTIAEHYQELASRQRVYLEVRDSLREHAGRIRRASGSSRDELSGA